jgi:hypothetical protein
MKWKNWFQSLLFECNLYRCIWAYSEPEYHMLAFGGVVALING